MKHVYPSAIDPWLAVILVGVPSGLVGFGIFMLGESLAAGLITIFSGLFVGGLIAALAFPCVYTLTDESLEIQSGLLNETIPLAKIITAAFSRSAWSAPALSLRRVKLTLSDGSRLISPKDRDAFIADLDARRSRLRSHT